ncbi:Epidermal growth factor receptor kinase substrate 8-like protein 2 [Orchesella cincta]|uniref:Epidermal growth factor receptor kinase substrate 8-like protein 2 n=1 Tax=Orchesella cincta TaxID=48709 RepID=A0A1D2NNT7_ORCCI|nr:Epidermal growth factor receptor kinase substrate 8-like protein 2 [Orchesella cincta]
MVSKKGKKKDHGEGLLSMRARPPHEREFVDILQKFKLSFNLLARLKTHIHDPNAPELVHFLFTPLALIVDASRDAHAAGLATRVVAPLLSRGAIELLNNCLTSKETELWHSLGDAWLLPREQWKGYVPQYQPVFMDGWSPTIPDSNNLGAAVASEAQRRMQERIIQAAQHEAEARRVDRERSISPVEIMPDDFASGQRAFVDSIRGRGGRVVMVTHPRTANNHKELTVVRGEYLEVLDDSKKWWKACNWKGQVAHVPHTIVSLLSEYPQEAGAYHGDRSALEDEMMQMELKNVLTIYREKRHIAIPRTPEVYIVQNSTPTEVQEWLKVKGFSTRIQKQLAGLNGGELFKLNRSQLEEYCGKEEGLRLNSQITISRNTSGYKTARSSELRAILAKARAKAEQPNGSFASTSMGASNSDHGVSRSASDASSKSPSPEKSSSKTVKVPVLKTTFKEENKNRKSRYDEDSEDDIVTRHFNFSDDGDDDSDEDDANKGTLGRMLKQKRREMLQQRK